VEDDDLGLDRFSNAEPSNVDAVAKAVELDRWKYTHIHINQNPFSSCIWVSKLPSYFSSPFVPDLSTVSKQKNLSYQSPP